MADILIKGMEMPKGKCWWHDEQGKEHECQFFPCTRDADNCPIIGEIPDKHGRIVDLDKVLDWLINDKRGFSMAMSAKLVKALSDAPVILEASATTPSRNRICPHYQGVCGLDEDILCYCSSSYETCDTYKESTE